MDQAETHKEIANLLDGVFRAGRHGHGGKSRLGYGMSLETPRKRMRLGLSRWSDVMFERQRRRRAKRGPFRKSKRALAHLFGHDDLPILGGEK